MIAFKLILVGFIFLASFLAQAMRGQERENLLTYVTQERDRLKREEFSLFFSASSGRCFLPRVEEKRRADASPAEVGDFSSEFSLSSMSQLAGHVYHHVASQASEEAFVPFSEDMLRAFKGALICKRASERREGVADAAWISQFIPLAQRREVFPEAPLKTS